MWRVVVLVCASMVAAGAGQETEETESKVVTISQGQVRGFKAANYDVFQFLNIPYAVAMTGPDKFKAPMAPGLWMGVIDAVDRRIICPQNINPILALFFDMREDCLVANIHVPNTNETNLPVLVLVHGGAYKEGGGAFELPNGLSSDKNIIVVTFNYRLGVHGFLCLGTEDAPGNAGMKDQVALLRWVQNNIDSFGGNPGDVTISGCSAGGSSVDLLTLSTMTEGLFQKAIAESGCSLNTFSTQIDPLDNALIHAQNLGYNGTLSGLGQFYTTAALSDLMDDSMHPFRHGYVHFQPCVERNIGQERFLEDAPVTILKSGNFSKIPLIYGYATHEGLLSISNFNDAISVMNDDFSYYLPFDLQFENETHKLEVANKVKEFYFGTGDITENSTLQYLDFMTDSAFLSGILRTISLRVDAGQDNIYLYEYSFTHNQSVTIPNTDGMKGADHCDQLDIILDHDESVSLSEEAVEMAQTMRGLIYDFIRTGNPTPSDTVSSLPTWPPVGANRSPHYSIGDTIQVAGIPVESRALLWDGLYESYSVVPQPPAEIVEDEPTETPEDEQTTTETAEDEETTTETAEAEETTTETAEEEEITTETAEEEETTTETAEEETTTEAYEDDETTTEAGDDSEPTTEGYNSANNLIFSHQLWVLYTIVLLITFK
ncbi:juvenile hormone esterase-like [Ostrinia furnacalis]|uniref:juvenile hormone esterase-like n=1 Tax=Ostrinia furnacalis TaxID=93504 RepID=UPI00103F04BF|nr:juvenile hormone esterase-like [Ostrinia furnacalis]